jgi:hypothetical protein
MLDNCCYDRVKILHELSSIAWFIDKCGKKDVENCGHPECKEKLAEIAKDVNAILSKMCSKCE